MDDFIKEILNDISRWDADYRPDQGVMPRLDALADGAYTFEVAAASLERTQNTRDAVLRLVLRVDGGARVEKPYFFGTQEQVNKLGADLCALGYLQFERPKHFSAELGRVLPSMKGLRFRASKTTEQGKDGKQYHKLVILGRVGPAGAPARPAAPAAEPEASAATDKEPVPF